MKGRASRSDTNDAGFLLVEAVIAVALLAICAAAALAVVAAVSRGAARTANSAALSLAAQNVLTDLRAATAYDPDQLARSAGRPVAFDVTETSVHAAERTIHLAILITPGDDSGNFVAAVTASGADGTAVTVRNTLVVEAPAPASVLPASTPPPAAAGSAAPAASGASTDGIRL